MSYEQHPYIHEVPAEHKRRTATGELALTELGVIHLCTLVEQRHPDKAALAANFRRSVSVHCQERRTGGNN